MTVEYPDNTANRRSNPQLPEFVLQLSISANLVPGACLRSRNIPVLMSTPGVGPVVALTFVAAIDDAGRFASSKQAGAHFGLTPKRYQSGEKDVSGRISKIGDADCRPGRDEKGQGRLGPQAGSDPAPDAPKQHGLCGGESRFGEVMSRSCKARD
jgi:hypothetical protein